MTAPSLIEPTSTTDPLKASVVEYTNARIALATTVLGGGGASLAWLFFLAAKAHDEKLFVTVAIGATIGFGVHWLQHYVRVAIRERNGETTGHRLERRPLIALLWAATIALVALSAEHFIIETVGHYFRLLLASLASLVPAGAIIGWTMNRGRKDDSLILTLANGLWIGLGIALVTGIIWTIAFGNTPWGALIAWWGLIGLGTHLVTRHERNAVGIADPVAAVVIVFIGVFLVNLLPTKTRDYDKLGAFRAIPLAVRWMAAELPVAPGLPGPFSEDQENEFIAKRATADSIRSDAIARARAARQARPGMRPLGPEVDSLIARPAEISPIRRSLAVWGSDQRQEYIFSWLVVVCFALGVGLAPSVERALRPSDYPNSETFGRDVELTVVMVALVIAACVTGRLTRNNCSTLSPNSATRAHKLITTCTTPTPGEATPTRQDALSPS